MLSYVAVNHGYDTYLRNGLLMGYAGPMSNDRYISVIGLGRNRSFDYDPVILQVVIGLGLNRFIELESV